MIPIGGGVHTRIATIVYADVTRDQGLPVCWVRLHVTIPGKEHSPYTVSLGTRQQEELVEAFETYGRHVGLIDGMKVAHYLRNQVTAPVQSASHAFDWTMLKGTKVWVEWANGGLAYVGYCIEGDG